jgi:hypothetical protein
MAREQRNSCCSQNSNSNGATKHKYVVPKE